MVDKTFDIWIEFQEVGLDTSLGLEHRSLTVRFSRAELQVVATSVASGDITPATKTGNVPVFTWDLIFPPSGDISFPVGQGGSHPHVVLGKTPPKGKLMTFDTLNEWIVPNEGGPYELEITFHVPDASEVAAAQGGNGATNSMADPAAPATTPTDFSTADKDSKEPYRGWTGTLVLPPIEIPQK